MKKDFSTNTTEVFAKTIFHYVPELLKYIDEIREPRKRYDYSMRYLIMSEMLMFLSEGKSQRFTETAYNDNKYLENIGKIIKEDIRKIPDAEISMLELKLVANNMAISIMNEMIKNEDKKKENETEEEIKNKSIKELKQDCELNASKRMLSRFRKTYPRLLVKIIADSLYPSIGLIELCEKEKIEYIFVLKDKKIPKLLSEFLILVSMPEGNREIMETKEKILLTLWKNDIDYKGKKVNVIRKITKNNKWNRFRACILKRYKSNKSNIYNNTNNALNIANNRTFRYMWRF